MILPASDQSRVIAAVDLGSNSFHMVVARSQDGTLLIIDRLREMVRLGGGFDEHGRIGGEAAERAIECLGRFGQRLRDVHADNVRTVGTNTLRRARKSREFIERAETALGQPIEIVSGIEEARLVYLGVAYTSPDEPGRRFVVDIGGGSTELIIGRGFQPEQLESLYAGCVSFSQTYFPEGKITPKRFCRACLAARIELEPIQQTFRRMNADHIIGSSGTIRTTASVLEGLGLASGEVTRKGLETLADQVALQPHTDRLEFPGLDANRRAVFPGGLAILLEVFRTFDMKRMRVSEGALREGLLYDLLGRLSAEDARERSVRSLETLYHIDSEHADRVEGTVLSFHEQVAESWRLGKPWARLSLGWAARLHEVGLAIAHAGYQKHGAYLLANSDLPGFSRDEQTMLALLVGAHRRKINTDDAQNIPKAWRKKLIYLVILLRLGVLLHRSRSAEPLPPIHLETNARALQVLFPQGWLDENPLTLADLNRESRYLKTLEIELMPVTAKERNSNPAELN